MGRAVLWLLVGACSYAPARLPSTGDADGVIDVPSSVFDAAPVDAAAPFSNPLPIAVLASASEDDDPSATEDLLELYFNSSRPGIGATDLWVSKRTSRSDPWGIPTLVPVVNTTSNEGPPEISPDGLTLVFSSDRPGGQGGHDIFITTRASRTAVWNTPVRITELSTTSGEFAPFVQSGGLRVVLSSSRPNGVGAEDLWTATRTSLADPFGVPQLITELGTTSREADAWLSADGLTILFDSDRPGSAGLDLWMATRATPTGAFGPPVQLDELNSSGEEQDPWVSPDGTTIFFASDRATPGNLEIFEASR
jgi:hypothetical protein